MDRSGDVGADSDDSFVGDAGDGDADAGAGAGNAGTGADDTGTGAGVFEGSGSLAGFRVSPFFLFGVISVVWFWGLTRFLIFCLFFLS